MPGGNEPGCNRPGVDGPGCDGPGGDRLGRMGWQLGLKTKDKKVEVCVCVYKLTLTPQHSIDFTLGEVGEGVGPLGEVGEGVGQLRVGVEDVIWGWQNKVPNYTDSSSCHGSSCIT